MEKTSFSIPKGVTKGTFEIIDNTIIFEYEKEEEFKAGDYIKSKISGKEVIYIDNHNLIFKNEKSITYLKNNQDINSLNSRKLSKTEIIEFNEELAKNGYKFNHETLKIVKLRERAKKGCNFYYVSANGATISGEDNRSDFENKLYESGNYHILKVNAQIKAKEWFNINNK